MKIVQKTIRVLLNWQFLIPTLFAALLPTKPGAQDTHNILQKNFPAHAPPFPWNEKTCTDEGHPSTYLTFSWGDPLPENRIFRALNDAEDNVLEMVDNGFGGYQIPDDWILGVDGARNIRIQVRPYKEHYWSTNKFVVFKSRLAVELLRACGLEKGEFREMWGYVFNLGKMIGYIWLEQGRIVPFGSGNRTAEFLDS